jgi:hypothetical protein
MSIDKLQDALPYVGIIGSLIAAIVKATGEPVEVVAARVSDYCQAIANGDTQDVTDPLLAEVLRAIEQG